ncbi:MAG: hypothetical protein VW397_02235 [Candidatus Margulisiibacteriota bacterium]
MSDNSNRFKAILKKKGTGKTMSKHMDSSDVNFVTEQLVTNEIPLTTRATLLTAWIMLDKTDDEQKGLTNLIVNRFDLLPKELWYLIDEPISPIDTNIHNAINGKAISPNHVKTIFNEYYANNLPDYKLATFLEALRLKEETFEENTTIYDYFRNKTTEIEIETPILLDIATPYDGFNRNYFLQPFVSALLAAAGIPSILHGVKEVSPKKGVSTHKVLKEANKNVNFTLDDIKRQIETPNIGWGYIDQNQFCNALYKLNELRVNMVKRPVLATIEKWLRPVKANKTVCLTGFTHPPYKQKTLDIINHAKKYESLILIRGVEGSTLLPPDRRTPFITMEMSKVPDFSFRSPKDFDFEEQVIELQDPEETLTAGLQALSGKNEILSRYLCYQVLSVSQSIGKPVTMSDLGQLIRSGKALEHWNNAH